jgi:hypothetical protein
MAIQSSLTRFRSFVHAHDELPAFQAGYLVITVIVAAMFNIGAFALLIAAHTALDVVKYREFHGSSWRKTMEGLYRENSIDVLLLLIAMVFSVYLHHTMGLAAVSGVMRGDLVIVRMIGILIPKVEILHDFLNVMAHLGAHLRGAHLRIGLGWSPLDRLCMFLLLSAVILLGMAPSILSIDPAEYLQYLSHEMIPWM